MNTLSYLLCALALGALASTGASLAAVTISNAASGPERIPIYFPAGATGLTPAAQTVLDETAQEARDASVTRVVVVGYEGGSASEADRQRTASARAYAIQQGLMNRGIDPRRLYVMASAAHPSDDTAPAFIADRRAEIIIEHGTPGF